jgi:hypothetical protein
MRAKEVEAEKGEDEAERGRPGVVRHYLLHILDKLGVSTRVELVLYGLQKMPEDGGARRHQDRAPEFLPATLRRSSPP